MNRQFQRFQSDIANFEEQFLLIRTKYSAEIVRITISYTLKQPGKFLSNFDMGHVQASNNLHHLVWNDASNFEDFDTRFKTDASSHSCFCTKITFIGGGFCITCSIILTLMILRSLIRKSFGLFWLNFIIQNNTKGSFHAFSKLFLFNPCFWGVFDSPTNSQFSWNLQNLSSLNKLLNIWVNQKGHLRKKNEVCLTILWGWRLNG